MEKTSQKTKKLTLMGIFLAMTVILSLLEHALPPIVVLPINLRMGISNVMIMYTLFLLGKGSALIMAVLKSLFVMLTRGVVAGFMSFCGGLVSLLFMLVLLLIFQKNITYVLLSIFGAIGHNMGQIVAASVQMKSDLLSVYWPFLLLSGVSFGVITGIVLSIIMPIFNRLSGDIIDV